MSYNNEGTDKEGKHDSVSFAKLFRYATPADRLLTVLGCFCGVVVGCSMPTFAELFGQFYEDFYGEFATYSVLVALAPVLFFVVPPPKFQSLGRDLAIMMTCSGAVILVAGTLQVACLVIASHRQAMRLRRAYLSALMRQDIAWYDLNKPGAIGARLTTDIQGVKECLGEKLGNSCRNLAMVISGFILGFVRSWRLTLVMISLTPLFVILAVVLNKLLSSATTAYGSEYGAAASIAAESLQNSKSVQVMNLQQKIVGMYTAALDACRATGVRRTRFMYGGTGFALLLVFSTYGIAMHYGSVLLKNNTDSTGDIVTAFFSTFLGTLGFGLFYTSFSGVLAARAAAGAVFATIDHEPSVCVDKKGQVIDALNGAIELQNVAFRYPKRDDQVFKGLDIKIRAGETTAIVGTSGTGKSTIVNLIQRFYDADDGSVTVDGVNLRDVDIKWWRSQIGVVSQVPSLFSGSVLDNVRVGCPDASEDDVVRACEAAKIHDLITTLPDGYNTDVGSIGSQLSGGEKQRIAIARAILRDPKILLLDEATSAVDTATEGEIQTLLQEASVTATGTRRTVVVVAHRLSAVKGANHIYVMGHGEGGAVVQEHGTYNELMALDGAFARLAHRQESATSNPTTKSPASSGTKAVMYSSSSAELSVVAADHHIESMPDASIGRIWSLTDRRGAVYLGLLGSLISGLVWPAYAIILPKILDAYALDSGSVSSKVPLWASLYFVVGVGALIGWLLMSYFAVSGEALTRRLRTMLMANVLRLDQTFFEAEGNDASALTATLDSATEKVHQLVGPALGVKVQSATAIIGGAAIAFYHSWEIALLSLAGLPLVFLYGFANARLAGGWDTSDTGPLARAEAYAIEAIANIRTVVTFSYAPGVLEKFNTLTATMDDTVNVSAFIAGGAYGLGQFSVYGTFSLCIWYGGGMLDRGEIDLIDLLTASMALLIAGVGAGEANGYSAKVDEAKDCANKVFRLIDREPTHDAMEQSGLTEIPKELGIEMKEVAFVYPTRPQNPVLRDLSCSIPQGTHVGITGHSGCGKSTMLALLCRMHEPLRGDITVNNAPLHSYNTVAWRNDIAAVLQESPLFSGSVRDNLLLGAANDASNDDIVAAAKAACVHDEIIAMHGGYDTDVGERGNQLSIGQRQRVAIARGLLRKPKVLILDEATSALDASMSIEVMDNVRSACRASNTTVIAVAHRLATIVQSDLIVYMEEGVAFETGSHESLVALPTGAYRALFMQSTKP